MKSTGSFAVAHLDLKNGVMPESPQVTQEDLAKKWFLGAEWTDKEMEMEMQRRLCHP